MMFYSGMEHENMIFCKRNIWMGPWLSDSPKMFLCIITSANQLLSSVPRILSDVIKPIM